MPESQFLTIEEVASLTRRTPNALYTERHRGEGVGALGVRVGRRILWRQSDLDQWFDSKLAEAGIGGAR